MFENHTVWRRLNYRNISLQAENPDGHTINVVVKGGESKPVRWLGYITREDARISGGRPVKLNAFRVDNIELEDGEYVQGCLVYEGVYGVVDTVVSIIKVQNGSD